MEDTFANASVLTSGILLAAFTLPTSCFLLQLSFPPPGSFLGDQPAQVSSEAVLGFGLHN